MERKKILWLCSWYPGAVEPFNGDFIQRHARAAALYNDIYVIHVYGDSSGQIREIKKDIKKAEGLTEHLVYFPRTNSLLGRVKAHFRWLSLFRQAIRKYMVENGKPDLVHVHIPHKAGHLGLWLRSKYKLPFVVSEHWGIYNEVEQLNYAGRPSRFKRFTKTVFEKAARCISVSRYLAEGVNRLVVSKPFTIIHNVTDTSLFFYKKRETMPFRFIHVSNMVPLKNAEGILRAFQLLRQKGADCTLSMLGDTNAAIRNYAVGLGLSHPAVTFSGEVPYQAVAAEMQLAHCLVLYSNIENSPCVIGEALCTGMPVIATSVGGVPELVNENNGILVQPGDDTALAAAMEKMMALYGNFDGKKIAEDAQRIFGYDIIGKQFDEVYTSVSASR